MVCLRVVYLFSFCDLFCYVLSMCSTCSECSCRGLLLGWQFCEINKIVTLILFFLTSSVLVYFHGDFDIAFTYFALLSGRDLNYFCLIPFY
uniref:Secreted protein n=1 Tax=Ixodes ricinus TaxID=34613 RepID=A0A6B0U7A1_IXORI